MVPVYFKSGVSLKGIQPVTVLGIQMCARGFWSFGLDKMTVTSVTDGKHREGSLHYKGLAFDLRTRDLTKEEVELLADHLRGILEGEWDVVVEKTHIHVEFDPD